MFCRAQPCVSLLAGRGRGRKSKRGSRASAAAGGHGNGDGVLRTKQRTGDGGEDERGHSYR
jgi:hypothetical protein